MSCGLGCYLLGSLDVPTDLWLPQSALRLERSSSSVRVEGGLPQGTGGEHHHLHHGHTSRNALKEFTPVLLRVHGVPQVHFAGRSEPSLCHQKEAVRWK